MTRAVALGPISVAFSAFIAACGGQPTPTAALLEIVIGPDLPARPTTVEVVWYDSDNGLFRRELPEEGMLPTEGNLLASVQIELSAGPDPVRRVVARGRAGGRLVGQGAAVLNRRAGAQQRVTITLTAVIDDRDGDGVPDTLDACPGDDFLGCSRADGGPSAVMTDAQSADAGMAPEAAAPPGSPEAGAPKTDVLPVAGQDGPPMMSAPDATIVPVIVDAAPDNAPPPMMAPASAPVLSASVATAQQINLAWTDGNDNETGFLLERAVAQGAFAKITDAQGSSWIDTTAGALQSYRYRIKAVNAAGGSPWSNVVEVTTPAMKFDAGRFGTGGATPETDFRKAQDGNVDTYFYGVAREISTAYVGVDAGVKATLTKLRFHPRKGMPGAMLGGKFEGSNTGPYGGYEPIITVTQMPTEGWNELAPPATAKTYRYFRYVTAGGQAGNVAEVEFWGAAAP